jgi:hypothetical protein
MLWTLDEGSLDNHQCSDTVYLTRDEAGGLTWKYTKASVCKNRTIFILFLMGLFFLNLAALEHHKDT